ncbi:Intersectin 1 (SH3 domain protein), variant 2 [Balamuthia mandrillaris]
MSYEHDLWEGLDLVEKRYNDGKNTANEVIGFFLECAAIEEHYVKSYQKLLAKPSTVEEGGTLGSSWYSLRTLIKSNMAANQQVAAAWQLAATVAKQTKKEQKRKASKLFSEAQKLKKEQVKGRAEVAKLKSKQHKAAKEAEQSLSQYEKAQKDNSLSTVKLVKLNNAQKLAQQENVAADKLYKSSLEEYNSFYSSKYQVNMKQILHEFQALDEERIESLKEVLENYIESQSVMLVSMQQHLAELKQHMYKINTNIDVSSWITANRTGLQPDPPVPYEPYGAEPSTAESSNSHGVTRLPLASLQASSEAVPFSPRELRSTQYLPPVSAEGTIQAKVVALFEHHAEDPGELSFKEGDVINVLEAIEGEGWWKGELDGRLGIFPSNYCEYLLEDSALGVVVGDTSNEQIASSSVDPAYWQSLLEKEKNEGVVYVVVSCFLVLLLVLLLLLLLVLLLLLLLVLLLFTSSRFVADVNVRTLHKAFHEFTAENEDELSISGNLSSFLSFYFFFSSYALSFFSLLHHFSAGQVIKLQSELEDWYIGQNEETGLSGLFPANYVQKLSTYVASLQQQS